MKISSGGNAGGRLDVAALILRIGIGLTMLMYGSQKMLGLFGGHGFAETVSGFEKGMGISPVLAMISIAIEFFAPIGLLVGFLTPVAAGALAINMAVATYFVSKRPDAIHDLFTSGDPAKMNGVLYPLLLCVGSLALAILGAGKYSLDAKFFRRG